MEIKIKIVVLKTRKKTHENNVENTNQISSKNEIFIIQKYDIFFITYVLYNSDHFYINTNENQKIDSSRLCLRPAGNSFITSQTVNNSVEI